MKINFCFLASCLLLVLSVLFAQTPEWVYQYVNPQSTEYPYSITVDSVGNTYTTGCIFVGNSRGLGIIKLNSTGGNEWFYFNDTLGVGETGYDITFAFSRVYLTGGTGMNRLVVLSVDTLGQELWLYLDSIGAEGRAIMVSSSHHIYVCGIKYPSPSDWVVLKLDSLGNLKWRYIYNGPAGSYDEATSIAIDENENIYVGGYSTGFGTASDFTVIKLDSAGNEKWVYRYDGPAHARDEIETIALDTAGNIYMTGNSAGGGWDICAIKVDSSGQEKWVYRYNGAANSSDRVYDLLVDDSSNVYVSGNTLEDTVGLFTVIKIDSVGNEVWRYGYAGSFNRGGTAICLTSDGFGAIYSAGKFTNLLNRPQIAMIKLNAMGESLWTYVYPHVPIPPWGDASRGIVADISGNVYLTGEINVSSFNDDIVVMKFGAQVGAQEVRDKVRNDMHTLIFRNGYNFLASDNGYLQIYDVLGRVVIKEVFHQNQRMYIKLQPGVYFLKVEESGDKIIKKIIIL